MRSGYVVKLLDNIERLVKEGDATEQITAAREIVESGRDANQAEWDALDSKVGKLEGSRSTANAPAQSAATATAEGPVVHGTKGHEQYVSGKEPGTLGNQIGYPGTEQDQDMPGQKKRTVPGVKPPKDEKK